MNVVPFFPKENNLSSMKSSLKSGGSLSPLYQENEQNYDVYIGSYLATVYQLSTSLFPAFKNLLYVSPFYHFSFLVQIQKNVNNAWAQMFSLFW